jgi:DNA polymerase III gamma/tau subunit
VGFGSVTPVSFADLPHQPRAVAILRGALARDRLHHALLLTGPAGSGKRALALAVASALNCERAPGEGCGACATCERIAAGVHPDVITLAREGAAQIIPIETVRTQVVAAVGLPPHEARERLFLIDEATALPPAAANALLKTLEEPPARTPLRADDGGARSALADDPQPLPADQPGRARRRRPPRDRR